VSTGANISKLLAGLGAAKKRAVEAARQGLDIAGEHVIGQSQQLTPVDTGALQASATTEPAEANGTKISKRLGHNTSYAAAVHERLTSSKGNPIKHRIGQAKFLETAMRRSKKKVAEFVAKRIKSAL